MMFVVRYGGEGGNGRKWIRSTRMGNGTQKSSKYDLKNNNGQARGNCISGKERGEAQGGVRCERYMHGNKGGN
jgi:hypothetical protein